VTDGAVCQKAFCSMLHCTWESSKSYTFLISNFHQILNVVCFLLSDSLASELYMPTFWNTLSVPPSYLPAYEDGPECSKTLAYKIQMLGNHPEDCKQKSYMTEVTSELIQSTTHQVTCSVLVDDHN
jgi:hypothetical protein